MKKISINNISELRNILETNDSEALEICLENKVYELCETIDIKRSNFVLKGNGATIKGSKKIDLSALQRQGELVKIDLSKHDIPVRDFHSIQFPWCGESQLNNAEADSFGTVVTDGPQCGGVYAVDVVGPDIELFYNGVAMQVTRYPKDGYINIKKTLSDLADNDPQNSLKEGGAIGIIVPDDDKFTKMEKADEALLFGYWSFDWSPHYHSIKSVDAENNVFEVDGPYDRWGYWDARGQEKLRGRFYATNVYEALDEPGSWFVDRKNSELYIHPFPEQNEVEISFCGTFFTGNGISRIAFENLTLCQGKSCGFSFCDVSDVTIENMSITNIGEWAVIADKSTNVRILDTKIEHTGGGGIYLAGGDRVTLTPSGNIVKNCEISNIARWYRTYTSGIELRGVGATVSGCRLHHLPHMAILYLGNNHIIENNEIYCVCNTSNDAGAIYSGRDYTFYGTIIRNNFFHDFYGLENGGCSCLYFDDCMSSTEVYGNIFANLAHAIQLGGGHDFKIHNNVFYNCDRLLVDKRGVIGAWMNSTAQNMRARLKASPYKNDAWKNAFPKLFDADIDSDDFFLPYGNEITYNSFINCGNILIEDLDIAELLKFENNTFVKRDKQKVYDNACHNLQYLEREYKPLKID